MSMLLEHSVRHIIVLLCVVLSCTCLIGAPDEILEQVIEMVSLMVERMQAPRYVIQCTKLSFIW